MFPYFNILGKTVGSYAVCGIIGLAFSVYLAVKLAKSINYSFEDIMLCTIPVALGMFLGGHFLYGITKYKTVLNYFNLIQLNNFKFSILIKAIQDCFGGMVFYGGFFGALLSLIVYINKIDRKNKSTVLDIFSVCIPLFHCFGRIGCFLGGCCYGIKSNFGFTYSNSLIPELNGTKRFPVALVESVFNLILFFLLLYIFKKQKEKGNIIYTYLSLYPLGRFSLEFLRGDTVRGIVFGLSTSQWISIILFFIGITNILKQKSINKCRL